MRRFVASVFALLLPVAAAAETRLVTLKSGEEIYGEVVEAPGALEITTVSGKKRTVPAGDVESVQSLNGTAKTLGREARVTIVPSSGALPAGEVTALQTRIMTDPKMMEALLQLAQDPQIMAAVRDPKLLAAIQAGDVAALERDPNLAKVASDPRVRALMEALKAAR